ncbi:MAG: DUF1501 domain-containing protein [Burkholderiales bacterium]|nr:DUF1501 domain-containing protein [Burkholderiales bacterium]
MKVTHRELQRLLARRRVLKGALGGVCAHSASALGLPLFFGNAAQALAAMPAQDQRILVVMELSGGNDGLNTLVPYADDAYYRHRPNIGIKPARLRKIDDRFGFSPGMAGFERLYKDGKLAIVHGCGYDQPSFSHFTSMAYWHTAAPNSGGEFGWVGQLADALAPEAAPNFLVNIDGTQSLAVRSRTHTPVVFDDPEKFVRKGFFQERPVFEHMAHAGDTANPTQRYLLDVARSAQDASALVREAWARYQTPVDYGIYSVDLDKVVALIEADLPTRLYYVAYRYNAFDTHVHQGDLHARQLTYVADAVLGFMQDLQRIGRAQDVTLLIFSEFGRRVPENTSLGTDHGTANLMFMVGDNVKGGHYGTPPSLTQLDEGDNLLHTMDFRRVYATAIEGWMGLSGSERLLGGRFDPLPIFG